MENNAVKRRILKVIFFQKTVKRKIAEVDCGIQVVLLGPIDKPPKTTVAFGMASKV